MRGAQVIFRLLKALFRIRKLTVRLHTRCICRSVHMVFHLCAREAGFFATQICNITLNKNAIDRIVARAPGRIGYANLRLRTTLADKGYLITDAARLSQRALAFQAVG